MQYLQNIKKYEIVSIRNPLTFNPKCKFGALVSSA